VDDRIPLDTELVWDSFHEVVNMTSEELRIWLLTEASGEEAFGDRPDLGLPEGHSAAEQPRRQRVAAVPDDGGPRSYADVRGSRKARPYPASARPPLSASPARRVPRQEGVYSL
jgi:hypothetical protein